jgi:hypothetical protein
MSNSRSKFPWPDAKIPHYTAYRIDQPLQIDGRLDEACWKAAPRSSRFVDLVSGEAAIHDTRTAVLWDDEYLYVGFWIEEPCLVATMTERDDLVWKENDVEVFIAGKDAYYEFEINALGTIYEALFVWEDAYERGEFCKEPEFARDAPGARPWNGVGFQDHPRGPRLGFFKWDMPGLRWAVSLDGVINDSTIRDRGWTVEVAFPWAGMEWLARGDGRAVPPREGDVWRMDFSRFNQYKAAPPAKDSGGWAWSAHGVWDSHIPECFPYIHFTRELCPRLGSGDSSFKEERRGVS